MATFYPSLETIAKFKVQPTEGEWTLLHFLGRVLDDSYEVYFNPYLNGDRPDVLIMRKGNGVMIIEVKDWNLDNFTLNEKKKWVYTPNNSVVKSPIDQVLRYKNNLYDLHIDQLLEMKINDKRLFRIVTCAVYFHCASQYKVESILVNPYKEDRNYQDFLKYNIDLFGKDGLSEDRFNAILKTRYLSNDKRSILFTEELYNNFKRILSPTMHMKSVDEPYNYTPKQKEIIYGKRENGKLVLQHEQRVKGVFGSGKTTVLAARAVQAYKSALKRNNNPRILILTYNVTLKNFIHDKLMRVDEVFPVQNFIIINYHQFINAELNNLNIEINVPTEEYFKNNLIKIYGLGFINSLSKKDLNKKINDLISDYLESNYYGNLQLFEDHKNEIVKYDTVLIDEIQDFHRPWMDIIKLYFRDPQGDYVLFGDVKQNIYRQIIENKDVVTNIQQRPIELQYCFRSDLKVRDLALLFQSNIFGNKYDVDNFSENDTIGPLGLKVDKEGYINYMYLSDTNTIVTLYNIIRNNILNKVNNIAPNDITILGYTANLLRMFDCYYRYASRERSNSMLETIESMYMTHLNFYGKEKFNVDGWFKTISSYLTKKLFPRKNYINDNDFVKIRLHIAKLFTIYDLYFNYSEIFNKRLEEECKACGISTKAFLDFLKHYKEDLDAFKSNVYNYEYKKIRDNKKLHFWMNSGTIKISTINSFKGWESEVVFLIIEPKYDSTTSFNMSFDELLYTGITRCKRHLVVINFGNVEYDQKFRPLIEQVK